MTNRVTVCVVGAGPAGIAVGLALARSGVDFAIVEKHTSAGGLWDIRRPDTPAHRGTELISSRRRCGLPGASGYPGHQELFDALAARFALAGLGARTTFGCSALSARRVGDGWTVTTTGGEVRCGWLVVAAGQYWQPAHPPWFDHANPALVHSLDFARLPSLAGRVLVVGAGHSGVDIACTLATTASVELSVRRGYHLLPKHVLGVPIDVLAAASEALPWRWRRRLFELSEPTLVRLPAARGLPVPDHRLFDRPPILSDQLPSYLREGRITVRPDVAQVSGREVTFTDGARACYDIIIAATGLRPDHSFLPEHARPRQAELTAGLLSQREEGLLFAGLVDADACTLPVLEAQARLICALVARDITTGGRPHGALTGVGDARLAIHRPGYVDASRYRRELEAAAANLSRVAVSHQEAATLTR